MHSSKSFLASRRVVLVGGGHTNLHVVRMWRMHAIEDVELTLISAFGHSTYSGMLPGTLAGLYDPREMQIDLYRFCRSCKVQFLEAKAVGLDARGRRILLQDRPSVPFDVASIGIGSVPAGGEIWRRRPEVLSIKPMQTFRARLLQQLDELQKPARERPLQIAIVGGGVAGVEVALCLQAMLQRMEISADLRLFESGRTVLKQEREGFQKVARRELRARGVDVQLEKRASAFEEGTLSFTDGTSFPAEVVIWAAGAAAPPALEGFELPKTDDGFLATRPTLQSTADAPVFVVGDTATFPHRPVPKAGVYAVREAPILWENLNRLLRGEGLKAYEPQSGFLSLLATGDGRAILSYGPVAVRGGWCWKLKDWIDRRFVRKYQEYRDPAESMRRATANEPPEAMRCAGCGGKASAAVLREALSRLDLPENPHVLQGLEAPDDAAILKPTGEAALAVSTDFFRAFLDDAYLVGRIAAVHALGDLWASGAEPTGALALATLPVGPEAAQANLLEQLLAGAVEELRACGAALVGGHTIEGADLTLGFTVFGRLTGERRLRKSGLQVGDRLILTKPLGTGVLLAAHQQAQCEAGWMQLLIGAMLRSNREAARAAKLCGVTAATDITGFGLSGHLFEMLDASGVSAELSLRSIPLLPGFAELVSCGIRSTLDPANRAVSGRMDVSCAEEVASLPHWHALFDPQTSGGLLLAAPESAVDECLRRLHEGGDGAAAVIGTVIPANEEPPRLRIVQHHNPNETVDRG